MTALTTPLSSNAVHVGGSHTFTTRAEEPEDGQTISFLWFQGDTALSNSDPRIALLEKPPGSTLSIGNVRREDAGTWTVLAVNGADVLGKSSATLFVLDASPQPAASGFTWEPKYAGRLAAGLAVLWLGLVVALGLQLRHLLDAVVISGSTGAAGVPPGALSVLEAWQISLSLALFAAGLGLLGVAAHALLVEVRGRAEPEQDKKDGPRPSAARSAGGVLNLGQLRVIGLLALLALGGAIALVWT